MDKIRSSELSYQEKMIQGSAWLSVGNIFSRLLGAIYIIPWYAWMGENARAANGLFNMGYTFYALFMMISTAGLPGAIAKQVARYNSMGEYQTSRRLFIKALQATAILGIFFGGVMFLTAPLLAGLSGGGAALIPVIQALSVAVVAFPCMSVLRGYFQGQQDMRPSAISQLVEQALRVLYMLLSVFIIMKVMKGDYLSAVIQSTFAASFGMIGSYGVLLFYWFKERKISDQQLKYSLNKVTIDTKKLLFETVRQAIPFILLGGGITFYKLIDQATFIHTMKANTNYSHAQLVDLYALFSANPDKLTMVVVTLGTSLALTSLPMLTELFTQKRRPELAKLVNTNIQLFAFIMFPAVSGMILLAYPLNTVFYSADVLGSHVLIAACLAGFISALFMMLSTTLQGISHSRIAVRYWLAGLVLKVVIQIPLIKLLEVYGSLAATFLGLSLTSALCLWKLRRVVQANYRLAFRRCLLILILTLLMLGVAVIVRQTSYLVLDPAARFSALLICLLTAGIGGAVYVYLSLKLRLVDQLVGAQARKWRQRLRIK
ncbi:putative polysaccharide biosynthesis protein [Enterococcus xiangfangensis]|uniref:Polysaccharide biosynthesis protein n=1 Tax=Enterococcus xiangfangensis TaxID=1296537 RepID=A0ABU3F7T4_9ENTE|nr:polysaccharide biosynthesis protein [Enterococcus xiangfangensis]MDT2758731.1 polysaccharide biosynthesis protein [Enterococcus xiangfangensis]